MRRNALVLALVLASVATPVTVGAATVDGTEKPRTVALGVTQVRGSSMGDLDAYTDSVGGQAPATWTIFSSWGDSSSAFPMADAEGAQKRGAAPMIWWRPYTPSDPADCRYASYANIAAGQHDDYVTAFARDAKTYNETVLLRFAPELNGGSKAWSVGRCGNDATTFLAAWRHIHDIFQGVGAGNVGFVWSVAKQSCSGGCNPYTAFYPGDDYVDYMAFSGFNWGAQRDVWTSMYDSFSLVTQHLTEISERPIIAVETGCNPDGGDKAAWIRDGYAEVYEKLPAIVAIVYMDVDLRAIDHPDWRLASPPEALAAYIDVVTQPEFDGAIPGR